MPIPVFKKAAEPDLVAKPPSLKSLPLLAAIRINNSRFGLLLFRCSYGAFALSLLWVFYPYIVVQPLWLLALMLGWSGLWWGYRRQVARCITGTLSFSGNHWLLEQAGRSCQLALTAEVLCWSWLIILPLRDTASGETQRLLLFGDALNRADNASLRRWLHGCLVPKA